MSKIRKETRQGRKKPGDALVFGYRHLPYGKYALAQIIAFPLFVIGVLIYFQFYSPWKGGFLHVRAAWFPVIGVSLLFLVVALPGPIRDLLVFRNERVEVRADRILFFNMFGRKMVDAKLSEVALVRAGMAITSKVKRYVFKAGGKSFYFSADIENADRLLKLLGQ